MALPPSSSRTYARFLHAVRRWRSKYIKDKDNGYMRTRQALRDRRGGTPRFAIPALKSKSPHFEQWYSNDGGKNWEVSWISDQTRVN
jgi:hypothetical protein